MKLSQEARWEENWGETQKLLKRKTDTHYVTASKGMKIKI
jgi:hypothetical protein